MNKKIILIILFFSFGCATKSVKIENLKSNPQLYALYNIHVDSKENRIFTTNYQQAGVSEGKLFIPICSRIEIDNYNRKVIKFRANSDPREYHYLYHKAVGEKLEDHIFKIFGPNCHKNEIDSLSKIDQEGIRKAQALPGMTKKAVIYAIGNPPSHVNNYNSNEWIYWKNRFSKFYIIFDNQGKVKSIKN